MQHLIEFLDAQDIEQTHIFSQLKCSPEEARVLHHLLKEYLGGVEDLAVSDILSRSTMSPNMPTCRSST